MWWCLASLTKIYAIPGIRLGCAVADREFVRKVRNMQPPWSVNTIAQAVGETALRDEPYRNRSRSYLAECRKNFMSQLQEVPDLHVYPGAANFLLIRIDTPRIDAPTLARRMLEDRVAVRVCDNFEGLDHRFFRVAVRSAEGTPACANACARP